MSRKRPTRRRQPFVIEPLNWVAPDVARDEATQDQKEPGQSAQKKDDQD